MVSPGLAVDLAQAASDARMTQAEFDGLILGVFNTAVAGAVLAFAMVAFDKVLKHNPGNPGHSSNPGHSDNPGHSGNPGHSIEDIISRAGMQPYEYHWFPAPEEEEEPSPRKPVYKRTKIVNSFVVVMTRKKDTCMIKLYEYLEGWKKKLRATWSGSGLDVAACDDKFVHIVETVRQAEAERKAALRKYI